MRTVGIICEYNPFHTGHKRQIDILRSMGYDCVICAMSGNYTQRGELAIFDKYTRAESALHGGADVIVELPFPFSSLSAEGFANAGVHILSSLGVDAISFGSECADVTLLECAAEAILSPEFATAYNDLQRSGLGSAAAYFEAIKKLSGTDTALLSNDILAISYIAAIKRQKVNIKIVPIKREGAAYSDKSLCEGSLPSASAIREALKNNASDPEKLLGYIPKDSLSVLSRAKNDGLSPVFAENIEKEILSFFKIMTSAEIITRAISRSKGGAHIAEDGCGIIERICRVARESKSYSEFLMNSYNCKYTDARINRVILFSLLGVSDKWAHSLPEYTVLLGANGTGRAYLSEIRKSCDFNIVTKPADAEDGSVQKLISEAADAIYTSALPQKTSHDYFIKAHPIMLKGQNLKK